MIGGIQQLIEEKQQCKPGFLSLGIETTERDMIELCSIISGIEK